MTDPEIAAIDAPAPVTSAVVSLTGLAADYLDLDGLFTDEELALRQRVRTFVDERIRPHIAGWYEAAHFPVELVKEMGARGLHQHRRTSRSWRGILVGVLSTIASPNHPERRRQRSRHG